MTALSRLHVIVLIGTIVAVCLNSPARADDGGIENVGGAVRLMKDQGHIRMKAETVHARVSLSSVEVDCVFVMENHGPADTVLIGFPDRSGGPDGPYTPMSRFRSWVDDVEVECVALPDASLPESQSWDYWWTKRVGFAAGQTRLIRDHYIATPGSEAGGMQWFTYILETGASWAGTIGSADIVVTLDGIDVDWLDEIDPRARVKGKTLRWRFRNFEPGLLGSPKTIYFSWLSTEARAERERRRKDVGAWDE